MGLLRLSDRVQAERRGPAGLPLRPLNEFRLPPPWPPLWDPPCELPEDLRGAWEFGLALLWLGRLVLGDAPELLRGV